MKKVPPLCGDMTEHSTSGGAGNILKRETGWENEDSQGAKKQKKAAAPQMPAAGGRLDCRAAGDRRPASSRYCGSGGEPGQSLRHPSHPGGGLPGDGGAGAGVWGPGAPHLQRPRERHLPPNRYAGYVQAPIGCNNLGD